MVHSYVVLEGKFTKEFVFDYGLIPAHWNWIFFNLSDPQPFLTKNGTLVLYDDLVVGPFSSHFKALLSGKSN
jgi:hypothetical protein